MYKRKSLSENIISWLEEDQETNRGSHTWYKYLFNEYAGGFLVMGTGCIIYTGIYVMCNEALLYLGIPFESNYNPKSY